MTIREMEYQSGLDRANIRFYEREGLLTPVRRENGYRDYSEEDLQLLLKIKLLRRLGFSLEAVRSLKDGTQALEEALARRLGAIGAQRRELNATEQVCEEMRQDGAAFPTLDARRYLSAYDRALRLPAGPAIRPTVPDSDRVLPVRCPWRRYFARMLDVALVTLLRCAVMTLVFRINMTSIPTPLDWLLGLLDWVLLIPLEGLLLSRFGTTPGKWIMGIRVESADGCRLSFSEAAGRCWCVFRRGIGWTIPIYTLYRLWKSYKAVTDGQGTEWDDDVTLVIRENRWWRPALWAGSLAAVLAAGVLCDLEAAMPLHRGTVSRAEFVENYNQAADFYDASTQTLLEDGTLQNPYDLDGALGGPLVLRLTEEDGVLTEVSWSREFSTPYYGFSIDARGKEAALFSLIAMAWPEGSLFDAFSQRSQDLISRIEDHDEGTLEGDLLGCHLTYTITTLGEESMLDGNFVGRRFAVSFSLRRAAA